MSRTGRDTLVIVPAHNEAGTIGDVVRGASAHPVDVLVVDDGSTDDTAARARAAGAEVLSLHPNRGKGEALRAGFGVASNRAYARVVTLDADMEHDPAEIPRFLAALDAGLDVVAGEREVYRSGGRRLSNRFATFWYRQVDPRITDTICGFRGFRTEVLARLAPPDRGFEFEQVLLLEAVAAGLRLGFVPVTVRTAAKTGVSPLDLVQANDAFDRWIVGNVGRLRLSRPRRLFLALAARAGLVVGRVLRLVLARRGGRGQGGT
ncbi:MAG: glycosyltransferase family 2 protein [Deltaproteobacteria bacterium]|nr:glycosyltransferase family 2 protein [Deltaproteobacteria bacterium]